MKVVKVAKVVKVFQNIPGSQLLSHFLLLADFSLSSCRPGRGPRGLCSRRPGGPACGGGAARSVGRGAGRSSGRPAPPCGPGCSWTRLTMIE